MIFRETPISGAFVIDVERKEDQRGYFARTWDAAELRKHGLEAHLSQCSTSFNRASHTLRGMHYQADPHGEVKTVRCTRGAIYDVIVDLRKGSDSFRKWFALELSADNALSLYVPTGCAHGFITLAADTDVLYQISTGYVAESARGVRWNDPAFGIEWPAQPKVISERDRSYADFR